MKKLTLLFSIFLVVAAMLAGSAWASDRTLGRNHQPSGIYKTNGTPVSTLININNLAGWIRNDGWSARIPSSGNSGVFFPRGTGGAIFQDGIVWGGNVNDGGSQVLRVGGQTYAIGTIGGRIISQGVAADPGDPDVRIYRIRRDYATADLKQDAAELFEKGLNAVTDGDIAGVRAQYETDWNEWPTAQGAPYYDRDSNGVYNAGIDEPGVADADQVVWFVCNDLNPGRTNALYGSNPIGFELQVTLWGYNRTDPLANVYFKKFTFIYKGTASTPANATITDMYVGQWSDPDMGDAGDDFSGCDTTLSLGYVYNGSAEDLTYAAFGLKPPAVGYDFLQGPLVDGVAGQDLNKNGVDDLVDSGIFNLKRTGPGLINLPMTAAFYFAAGGTYSDPPFSREGTVQWYNLLRGLTPISGTDFVHPNFPGQPTKFWLDGDKVAGTGRLDGSIDAPGDRRLGVCSGPFSMALGDTQEVVVGVVAGIGTDYISSIAVMKNNDIAVQNAYNDLFDLPKAPPAPVVNTDPVTGTISPALDKQIVLDWGSNQATVRATEDFDRKGYKFEGYNVYQVATASTSIPLSGDKREVDGRTDVRLLATFDKNGNAIRTIYDDVFDVGLGIIVRVVKQRGTDNGIVRELVVDRDLIRQAPLVNGQRYYFAVTAYGYNPSDQALTHALESTPQIYTGIPQGPNPGVRLSAGYGTEVPVTHNGTSDGAVTATVIDPLKLTGRNYSVTFRTIPTTFVYGPDTVTADILSWYVVSGSDTVARGVNQGPTVQIEPGNHDDIAPTNGNTFDYPITDGMYFTVAGPAPQPNGDRSSYIGTVWTLRTGQGFGRFTAPGDGALFRNQVTTSFNIGNYLGAVGPGVDPSQYRDIEFRFGDGGSLTQKGYRYRRIGTYQFQDYVNVPFQVWDISAATPRQLNVGWRDQNNDGQWNPDGNVEVIFVATSTYDGDVSPPPTPTYSITPGNATNTIPVLDHQYIAEWITPSGLIADIRASVIHISPNYVNSATDVFNLTAPAAPSYSSSTAAADVTQINVFPNPYYGFNRAETSRFARFVTFNHMPAKAEVRIFNLSGALVKAISKDDPTQFLNWDLTNHGGLPVASGVYIAYMTLKDATGAELGKKTLKLIVIQEQQYLDNF